MKYVVSYVTRDCGESKSISKVDELMRRGVFSKSLCNFLKCYVMNSYIATHTTEVPVR